jgi:hypothetical protein
LALLSQRSRWSLAATRKPLLRPLLLTPPLRPLTPPLRLLTPPLRLPTPPLRLLTPPLRLLLRRTDPFRIWHESPRRP